MYSTTPKENRKKVAALLIPATLTAVVAGITEPLNLHSYLLHHICDPCYLGSYNGYFNDAFV